MPVLLQACASPGSGAMGQATAGQVTYGTGCIVRTCPALQLCAAPAKVGIVALQGMAGLGGQSCRQGRDEVLGA